MSTHPEDPPSTPTAPRISVEPESHTHPSPATQGRSPTPQHQHTQQADDLDLRLSEHGTAKANRYPSIRRHHETTLHPNERSSGSPLLFPQVLAEVGKTTNPGVKRPRNTSRHQRFPRLTPLPYLNDNTHPIPHLHQQQPLLPLLNPLSRNPPKTTKYRPSRRPSKPHPVGT